VPTPARIESLNDLPEGANVVTPATTHERRRALLHCCRKPAYHIGRRGNILSTPRDIAENRENIPHPRNWKLPTLRAYSTR